MIIKTTIIKTVLILTTIIIVINGILMPFIFSKDTTAAGNTTNSNVTTNNVCNTTRQYVITLKGSIMDNPELKNATSQSLMHQFDSQGITISKDEQKIKQGVFVIESANSEVIQKLVTELSKDPRIQSVEENKCVGAFTTSY